MRGSRCRGVRTGTERGRVCNGWVVDKQGRQAVLYFLYVKNLNFVFLFNDINAGLFANIACIAAARCSGVRVRNRLRDRLLLYIQTLTLSIYV